MQDFPEFENNPQERGTIMAIPVPFSLFYCGKVYKFMHRIKPNSLRMFWAMASRHPLNLKKKSAKERGGCNRGFYYYFHFCTTWIVLFGFYNFCIKIDVSWLVQ